MSELGEELGVQTERKSEHSNTPLSVMLRSLAARTISFPVTTAANLAISALIIQQHGSDLFGAVALVSSLVLLVPFADFGLGAAVLNTVARGDHVETIRVIGSSLRLLIASASVIMGIGFLGTSVFSWQALLGITEIQASNGDLAIGISIALFGLSVPLSLGQRILIGLGKNHWHTGFAALTSSGALGACVVILYFHVAPTWLFIIQPTGLLMTASTSFFVGAKLLNLNFIATLRASGTAPRSLIATAAPMLILMIVLPLAIQTHRIWIAHQGVPAQLASYSLVMQFYLPLWSFVSIAGASLWPAFARQRARREASTVLLRQGLAVLLTTGLVLVSALVIAAQPLGTLLSGAKVSVPSALVASAAILLLVQTMQQLPGMYLTSNRGLWFQAISASTMALFANLGTWVLIEEFGPSTPLLTTATAILACQVVPGYFLMWRSESNLRESTIDEPSSLSAQGAIGSAQRD